MTHTNHQQLFRSVRYFPAFGVVDLLSSSGNNPKMVSFLILRLPCFAMNTFKQLEMELHIPDCDHMNSNLDIVRFIQGMSVCIYTYNYRYM